MAEDRPAFETIPLERGVTLRFRRVQGFKTELVRVFFRAPLDGPRPERQLFATMLSRGTAGLPDRRTLAARLESLYGAGFGVAAQRLAGRAVLSFRASTVAGRFLPGRPANLRAILGLVADALRGPPLRDGGLDRDVFEQERRSLLREYHARVNHKPRYAALRLWEEMFGGHPIGRPDTGTAEEIEAADPAVCLEEGLSIIRHGEADIYVTGPGSAAAAERLVARVLALPPRDPERFRLEGLAPPRARPRQVRESMDVNQARVALGFRLDGWKLGEARFVASLADAILGSGPSSKLFRNVRERRSLCYEVRSHLDAVTGSLFVGAGIDPARLEPALRAIRTEVAAMAGGRILEDEVRNARTILASSLEEVADTPGGMVEFFHLRMLLGRPERSLAEIVRGVLRARASEVPALMARARLDTVYVLQDRRRDGVLHAAS